jgi:hypothetical protein
VLSLSVAIRKVLITLDMEADRTEHCIDIRHTPVADADRFARAAS